MSSRIVYPPIVDSYIPAYQVGTNNDNCTIYFRLSNYNVSSDIMQGAAHVSIIKQNTGTNVVNPVNDTENNIYRSSGILINVPIQAVENESNLYYININNSDLIQGWTVGWIYKIQIRLSELIYNSTDGKLSVWLNNKANNFSEWSTVCVVKAIGAIDYQIPRLEIDTKKEKEAIGESSSNITLEDTVVETSTLELFGTFIREDPTELIHSYRFTLYDNEHPDVVLDDSGEIYCDQYQDVDSFKYTFKVELENNKYYQLGFKYETINKFVGGKYNEDDRYTFRCEFTQGEKPDVFVLTADNDDFANIIAQLLEDIIKNNSTTDRDPYNNRAEYEKMLPTHYHINQDPWNSPNFMYESMSPIEARDINRAIKEMESEEGRVAIKLYTKDNKLVSENICIRRTDSRSNYKKWEDLFIFPCIQEYINETPVFYDYTIESGVFYKYGVQTITNIDGDYQRNLLAEQTDKVRRDFTHSFLLGQNNQQLKFRFDNNINSFKYQLYDSKIDPIGSKYPYIARNANTYYRTFPITGLISFNMDDRNLFTSKKKIYKNADVIEDYSFYNPETYKSDKPYPYESLYDFTYEKDFREKVLEFLQDGTVKLFKSPTEGNILVRLMDINCSPNQTLNRLIYSFSSNAYELDEANMDNYIKYKLHEVGKPQESFAKRVPNRLGQLSTTVDVSNSKNKNINITELIKEKYDTGIHDMAGYRRTLSQYHHIRITFNSKPIPLRDSSGNAYALGHRIEFNGQKIDIYDPVDVYEFDDLIYCSLNEPIYICGDSDVNSFTLNDENKYNTIDITVDFLYDSIEDVYEQKKIKKRRVYKGTGQYFHHCIPNERIMSELNLKYYLETDIEFSRLSAFNSIEIEAVPGAAFAIQDEMDASTGYDVHVVGATGLLVLNDISDIYNVFYLGIQNKNGVIEQRETDVIMNYVYLVTKGIYKT